MIYTDGFHIVAPTRKELSKFIARYKLDPNFIQEKQSKNIEHYICPKKHQGGLRILIKRGEVKLLSEAKYYELYKSFKK